MTSYPGRHYDRILGRHYDLYHRDAIMTSYSWDAIMTSYPGRHYDLVSWDAIMTYDLVSWTPL